MFDRDTARRRAHRCRLDTLLVCVAATLAACAPPPPRVPVPAHPTIELLTDSITETPPLDRTHWGIVVHDPSAGQVLLARNAQRHFIPASNTKLVVGAVALGELGPTYRYETRLWSLPAHGDSISEALLLVASGDPTMSARFLPDDFATLDSIAAAIAAAGLRYVAGDLIVDATTFDDVAVHSAWEVGDLPFGYAAPVGAFAIAEGTFRLVITPGPVPGDPATAFVIGGDHLQPVAATVTTDTAGARSDRDLLYAARRDTVFIRGSIAVDAGADTVRLAVTDPVMYAGRALIDALRRRGVMVDGGVRVVRDSAEAVGLRARAHAADRLVASRASPPMSDIVAAILQPSQNWIAEQVLKTLGAVRAGDGSWRGGLEVERRYLIDVVGLDSLEFSLRDASGLSAQNLLTPSAIVRLLEHARGAPWGGDYRRALAAPGLRGSTLASRLSGLEGRVQAKTGTIANVNALSGFLTTDSGRELTFSILTNGSGLPASLVRATVDRLIMAIAREGGFR